MTLLTIYSFCWLFTEFEPLQKLINNIFLKFKPNTITESFWIVLGCFKCLSLWLTLIITLNPLNAILLSMLAQIHKQLITKK